GDRVGDPVVVFPLLVATERIEQRPLRWEPPVQGRPGHRGGGRHRRQRELPRPGSSEYLKCRLEDPFPRRQDVRLGHVLYILAYKCNATRVMTRLTVRRPPFRIDASVPFQWQPANPCFGLFGNTFTFVAIAFERYI